MKISNSVKLKAAIILISACSFLTIITSCKTPGEQVSYPADFNFSLRYGMGRGSTISTYDNTYTKDLIQKGTITTEMKLSPAEMDTVYKEMMKIGIFDYTDIFQPPVDQGMGYGRMPALSYTFNIQSGGKIKNILWNNNIESRSEKALELKELINLIQQIIISRPEYKALPEPVGAYQ